MIVDVCECLYELWVCVEEWMWVMVVIFDEFIYDWEGFNDDDEYDFEGVILFLEWLCLMGLVEVVVVEFCQVDDVFVCVDVGIYGICVNCGRMIFVVCFEV